ncbi:MAG: cyclic nucleotide-binding domain-containing protein [Planctomycetales bacterium]|nr:cyclic nucleotide-binding domain-containing protein [Planctomycetales bacterium]
MTSEIDNRTISLLQGIPILSILEPQDYDLLAQIAKVETYPEGTILFTEGEHNHHLYFVCTGFVTLDMLTTHCGRQTILSVGSGELLAWSALIGDHSMTATAVVTHSATLLSFQGTELSRLLQEYHSLGFRMMSAVARAISRRLLATRLQLLDLYHLS